MKPELYSFFKKLLLFAAFIGLALYLWAVYLPERYSTPFVWVLFAFFIFATIAFHVILINAGAKSPQHFIRTFMGATALKLLLYFSVIIIYLFINKANAVGFTLTFLFLYLIFSVFEVALLLKHFKKDK